MSGGSRPESIANTQTSPNWKFRPSTISLAADNVSNDFGHSTDGFRALTFEDIAYRFHVSGEIFIVDKAGEKLLSRSEESREWQFGSSIEKPLVSNWFFQKPGLPTVALHHEWQINKDGSVVVTIRQFDKMTQLKGSEVEFGKLIKEQKITLKDFSPINWVIEDESRRVVVRLTPDLWPNAEAIDVAALPIVGKNVVIFDQSGRLWGTIDGFSGQYFGVNTVQGTLALSFQPFKGAKLLGEAKEGHIRIKIGKEKITVQSERPFLPQNTKVNVYGIVDRAKKTERLHSVRTFTSDKEEQFLKSMSGG